jgi:SAM-dependent methyltransferase
VLATHGVFRERDDGRFELTDAADQLRTDVPYSVRDAVVMLTDPTIWQQLNHLAVKLKGQPPFRFVHRKSFWEYWAEQPLVDTFDVGMASMSRPENAILRRHYAFPDKGTVVDVAGGRGYFLRDVLKENPGLDGILFEQEHVLARNALGDIEASRYKLVAGDFFESVPAGDLYLLRHIPHDWGHEDAVRILSNVRNAMRPGARALIMDPVLPRNNAWHGGKTMDLICMSIYDEGHERDESEMRRMLTDSGLRLNRIIDCGFYVSITEAVVA